MGEVAAHKLSWWRRLRLWFLPTLYAIDYSYAGDECAMISYKRDRRGILYIVSVDYVKEMHR